MHADLDDLLTALYVLVDDLLPARSGAGRRPKITDAELVTLAVAQILLQCPKEQRYLRLARSRLSHLFPYIPGQSGYNKRLRKLAPEICRVISHLARVSPSFCDRLRLLDSTPPVPCGQSRQTVERSQLRGWAAYGYCASHSRHFWGLRLYFLCAPDGMPVYFCLAPANEGEREVAAAMLERARDAELLTGGETIVADKGFSGEFEQIVSSFDATLVRPDRKNETPRFGKLGGVRQSIESIYNTAKDQLNLEQHGGRIPEGVWVRVCQRVLALAAGVWHSWLLWEAGIIEAPGRHFISYDH